MSNITWTNNLNKYRIVWQMYKETHTVFGDLKSIIMVANLLENSGITFSISDEDGKGKVCQEWLGIDSFKCWT